MYHLEDFKLLLSQTLSHIPMQRGNAFYQKGARQRQQIELEAGKEKNHELTSVVDNRLSPLSLPTPESESFLLGWMPSRLNSWRKQ